MKYIFVIISFIFVYFYVSILKKNNLENQDPLNLKLFELSICGWNLLHVVFFFFICYFFNIKTILGYVFIFLIGIIWYFFEIKLFFEYNKNHIHIENNKTVYSSISYPRYDDLLFNLFGIILHMLIKCYFK